MDHAADHAQVVGRSSLSSIPLGLLQDLILLCT